MEMELEKDMPTDDASSNKLHLLLETEEVANLQGSASALTIKESEKLKTVQLLRDELQMEMTSDALHLGFLIEKGLISYDTLDQSIYNDLDLENMEVGDNAGVEQIEQRFRNEFMIKMSSVPKCAGLKGILMEKGLIESCECPNQEELCQEPDISTLINDINQFTFDMEKEPQQVNWTQFRENLAKIHKYYVNSVEADSRKLAKVEEKDDGIAPLENLKRLPQNLSRIVEAEDIDHISMTPLQNLNRPAQNLCSIVEEEEKDRISLVPLENLNRRAKHIRKNIRGLEMKMITLDHNFEMFCAKFEKSIQTKEHAERDMRLLEIMREGIGYRLTQLENDIRKSRKCLSQKRQEKEMQKAASDGGKNNL